jgi:adenosylmethionine-8-amino-7-oxononanoate aminotransferase
VPDHNSDSTGPNSTRSAVFRRSFKKTFPSAVRGEGVYIWGSEGKRYLDFSGSAAVNFIGHGVPEISLAMAEQAKQLEFVHTSQFTTPVAEQYARELIEFAGDNFRGGAVYFTCGGSEAVETALKLARQYQVEIGQSRRHQVLSRTQSYHGSTLGGRFICPWCESSLMWVILIATAATTTALTDAGTVDRSTPLSWRKPLRGQTAPRRGSSSNQ